MSHWLDDAAQRLAEGNYSRRRLLGIGGMAAASSLTGALARPLRALAHEPSCENFPCLPPDVCCGGKRCCNGTTEFCCDGECFPKSRGTARFGCCHDRTYNTTEEFCCRSPHTGACFNGETCCGSEKCCATAEFCCDGGCFPKSRGTARFGCCHDRTYNTTEEFCCPLPHSQSCFHGETCCSYGKCCAPDEECCADECVAKGTCKHTPKPTGCNPEMLGSRPCPADSFCCYQEGIGDPGCCAPTSAGPNSCCSCGKTCKGYPVSACIHGVANQIQACDDYCLPC